jgi:Putative peptidoglycan binding domain
MPAPPFKGTFKRGDSGLDCAGVKRALIALGHKEVKPGRPFGSAATDALKKFQHNHGLSSDGVYTAATHVKFRDFLTGYAGWLYRHATLRPHSRQQPPLPKLIAFARAGYPKTSFKWGLQPWIVPQAEAICEEFGLSVSGGWGTHPPHKPLSDHRWGGAVDLAGPLTDMQRCNLWADGLRGHTFRWVGGPAHDADGVEEGHDDHVHLSWYRFKATTIFGTSNFK